MVACAFEFNFLGGSMGQVVGEKFVQAANVALEHRIPLVFDEVITGFRLALGGAQTYYGVIPDLAVYGKGLGAGYPIGAVAGTDELMGLFDPSTRNGRRVSA